MIDIQSFKEGAQLLASRLRLGWDEAGCYDSSHLMAFLVPFIPYMPEEMRQRCKAIIANMLACQERRDWLGFADYLEVEVIALLESIEALMGESSGKE